MAYIATITTIGLAKLANAIATDTPLDITTMKVGDGGGTTPTPDPSDTDLVNEVYSAAPNRVQVDSLDDARVIAELVIPASAGGWYIREVGVYDGDGDLIAVAQHPETYKPDAGEGAVSDHAVRVYMVVSSASAITIQADPAAVVATREYVTQQLALLIPGGTTDQVLTKQSNASGDYDWENPLDVSVNVNTIEEVQTIGASQTVFNLTTVTTSNLAIFVDGKRLLPTAWTATDADTVTLGTTYTAGWKIHFVQNEPTGNTSFLQTAQNLADVPDKEEARANLELLTSGTYLAALLVELNKIQYPVGEIYITRRAGNPSSLLGFGTWEAYAQGRVLVGHDGADAAFNEVDKIGGAKVHALTVAEMPAHTHTVPFKVKSPGSSTATAGVARPETISPETTSSAGGGQAHNNLQPYTTVFMWKRTA